jgi:HEPN domain-containing protein
LARREHYLLLLRKAAQDEYLLDLMLREPDSPTEAFGFHAQQAVEKLLKALLVGLGVTYPHIHKISDLMGLFEQAGIKFPIELYDLRRLTPFAVEFRYDPLPEEPEAPLDKERVRQGIRDLRTWVTGQMEDEETNDAPER